MHKDRLGREYYRKKMGRRLTADEKILSLFRQTAWKCINARTINGSAPDWEEKAKRKYLERGIRLEMSKPEFYEWCELHSQKILSMKKDGLKPSIDRINDELHYSADNIRVISLKENSILGSRKGREMSRLRSIRAVIAISEATGEELLFQSMKEAAKALNICPTTISAWCNGKRSWVRSNSGYSFKFA